MLIHSAAGGVGLAAVQVARRAGAEISRTAGTAEKRGYLGSLGVPQVVDSRSLAFADEVRRLTGGEGVDVVLNSLAGEAMRRGSSCCARRAVRGDGPPRHRPRTRRSASRRSRAGSRS